MLSWLQLLRLPNLLTVPGDPLAGFLLAGGGTREINLMSLVPCIATGLLLYSAGVISNDWFDREEDKRERPERPIPSGRINPHAAILAAGAMAILGLGSAALAGIPVLLTAAALVALILGYNSGLKRIPVLGPIVMGTCRGLNLLLGAAGVGHEGIFEGSALMAAIGLVLYVASVTVVAAGETRAGRRKGIRWLPATALLICFAAFYPFLPIGSRTVAPGCHNAAWPAPMSACGFVVSFLAAFFAILRAWGCGRALGGAPEPRTISHAVGGFIQGLLPVQAAFAAPNGWEGLFAAGILMLLWPVFSVLARRFDSS